MAINPSFMILAMFSIGLTLDSLAAADRGGSNRVSGDWQTQTIGRPGTIIRSVSVVNSNVCWLAGDSGLIARTSDAGNNWTIVDPGIIGTYQINVIEGMGDSVAVGSTTASDTTFIFRTTNAGFSWTRTFSQPGGRIDGIVAVDSSRAFALGEPVGSAWTFLVTSNAGESWDTTATRPAAQGLNARNFYAFGTSTVYFIDDVDQSYSSGDDGNSWFDFHIALGPGPWFSRFNSTHDAIMAGSASTWHWTTLGGWTYSGPVPQPGLPPLGIVGALGTREYWLIQDALYYTSDAGVGWTKSSPKALDRHISLVDMVTIASQISAWAVGESDTVYHYTGSVTEVRNGRTTSPGEFRLSQNYPNPFNPSTSLQFELTTSAYVSLKVYDVLGKEIATLKEEELSPGTHITTWDAQGVASGVYYFRLMIGNQMKTARGVLLR